MTAFGILFAGCGAIALSDPEQRRAVWPALCLLFGIGSLFYLSEVIRPDRLVLSPLGLRFEGAWKNWSYRWEEVDRFRVSLIDGRVKAIYFDVRHPHGSILDGLARNVTETQATVSGLWEVQPEELAALLNEARLRWAKDAGDETGLR